MLRNIHWSHRLSKITARNPSQEELGSLLEHYQNARYEDAEKLALSITQEFPDHPYSWTILGVLLEETGRASEALNANQRAVQLEPQAADGHYNLANTFRTLGRLEEAEASYLQALALAPEDAGIYYNLGVTLQGLERLEESRINYKQATTLKSDYAEAHYGLGLLSYGLGKFEEAATSYRQLIALQPNYAEGHYNLGTALQDLGRLEEAGASYRQATTLKPDYAEAYCYLGVTLHKRGILEEAEASYRQAIVLKSDFFEALNNLGILLRKVGRLEEAEISYSRALALNPDYAEAHNNLGVMLHDFGRRKEAEVSYRQALALNPDYAEAAENLGALLYESGQFKKAIDIYQLFKSKNKYVPTHLLKCFYELDDRIKFYQQLDILTEKGETNSTIGSLTSRAEIRYGIKKNNTFVNDPFKYVVKTDLTKRYDFKNVFIQAISNILNKELLSFRDQTLLSKGRQTAGNVFLIDTDLVRQMESIIRSGIEKYRTKFKNSNEGFLVTWPNKYSLKGWVVTMKSSGHLAPHMHDSGWLSGAVYINIPLKKQRDSGNFGLCIDSEEPRRSGGENEHQVIDIATGDFILFPSSLMHYTIPFESDEERIVLAFDVVPE